MLLTVDVGNTNVTAGVFRESGRWPSPSPVWRWSTRPSATADELCAQIAAVFSWHGLDRSAVRGSIAASVVPPLDAALSEALSRCFPVAPVMITSGPEAGLPIRCPHPEEVGADRAINALAAHHYLGRSAIVADFGTATTFDCVNDAGAYLGGVIAPGPELAADALARRTAKLPLVKLFRPPKTALGTTTQDSLSSGLYFGYIGLVKEIVSRLRLEMGGEVPVLATGGLATLLASEVPVFQSVLPDLTLQGLRLAWLAKNKPA